MISASVQMKKKKKLFLIFHGRFPSNKAASLFAAKSAEAFAGEGLTVEMIVSRRLGREKGDPYDYYNVKKNFKEIKIFSHACYLINLAGNKEIRTVIDWRSTGHGNF